MPAMTSPDWISCAECRHRDGAGFVGHSDGDAEFMTGFKMGRGTLPAGGSIEADGATPVLLTLYSGWALRLGGSRSTKEAILGVVLPGDLVGLDTVLSECGAFRLVALTDVTYCQFNPGRWHELLARPALAERLLRIQTLARAEAEERRMAAAALSATGNLCHLMLTLHNALRRRKLAPEGSFRLPLRRKQLAAALGLSPLHLRRVLADLEKNKVFDLREGRVTLHDLSRLRSLAGNPQFGRSALPLI